MLSDPTCPTCLQGFALQSAGALLPGVPFCPDHELPGGGDVSRASDARRAARTLRPTIFESLFDRWQRRLAERLFGWTLPLAAVVLALMWAAKSAVRRPRTTAAGVGLLVVGWLLAVHTAPTLAVAVALVELGHAWQLLRPGSFREQVTLRGLAAWRSVWVYRRRWARAMYAADLEHRDVDRVLGVPRLARFRPVVCTPTSDLVRVRGLLGQRFADWEAAAPMLAHAFGATGFRVLRGHDRRLTLELERGRRGRSWDRESERADVTRRELVRPPLHELGGGAVPGG